MDDWIIVGYGLAERREVGIMASQLRRSRFEVVGYLVTLWGWFSRETPDGHVQIDVATLADVLGVPRRFLDCLLSVGWLSQNNDVLSIPHWDKWLSPSAKARHAAAYYQRFRRAQQAASNKCCTFVRRLYNDDDDDEKGEKGGPGEKGDALRLSNVCPDKCQTSEVWSWFRRYAAAWGARGPTSKRDRALLWRVCSLAAAGETWAKAAVEALVAASAARPGAYLQKLVLELGPKSPHVSVALAAIPLPEEITRQIAVQAAPKPVEGDGRPLSPEEGRELVKELMAAVGKGSA